MSLVSYRKKRSFKSTPEPTGGKKGREGLVFVVQQHAASHLHFDFRLEMEGVLKSWAIPKGPSTDPKIKRLAMMVEDHPYDYKNFEGIIPEGNYGAGTVIVWDEGRYEPLDPTKTKAQAEKILLSELKQGSLKFKLHGKKLKGEFALVRTRGFGENSWLLIKHRDSFANPEDITIKNKSVLSGKTLEKMKKNPDGVWGKVRGEKKIADKAKPVKIRKTAPAGKKRLEKTASSDSWKSAPKSPQPKIIHPMLAIRVDKPPAEQGWFFEIKWDGYRAIAICKKSKVDLVSRNEKSFNEKFYPIRKALEKLNLQAVLDGEIAVINKNGKPDFGALQNWRSEADGDLVYYIFDLLWLDGRNLMEFPLKQRKEWLSPLLPDKGPIRESRHFETDPVIFLQSAKKMGLEGIMAKKADSPYLQGDRNRSWLKIKLENREEVVIGGYTKNDSSPKLFSSLLVGFFSGGKLLYAGKIGTGFDEEQQKALMKRFHPLVTRKTPFAEKPDVNKTSRFRPDPPHASVVWLKPKLVCEVSYTEITGDGLMRHPAFQGMREDKNARYVHREKIMKQKTSKPIKGKKSAAASGYLKPADPDQPVNLLNPTEQTQVKKIKGLELRFTHVQKKYWPKEGYTKGDLLNYYYQVAPYILPYLKDRPQSMNRFPEGINGLSFYQKDVTGSAPDWIKKFPYHPSQGGDRNFLVVQNEADLLWMANLGTIEMNPWNSRIQKPDYPDWCLIDLDPSPKNSFDQVVQTALLTKAFLDSLKVTSYCKTSGATGMHIYIPLGAKYHYAECQLFAKMIVTQVNSEIPAFTSLERLTKKRGNKIYLDFLQNRPQATLAAPYSVRPKPGATVSTPLHWEEVKKGLNVKDYTIRNTLERIKKEGDLFKPVLGKGIDLKKILKTIAGHHSPDA